MRDKAVSPIVAIVLLTAITIALGFVVMSHTGVLLDQAPENYEAEIQARGADYDENHKVEMVSLKLIHSEGGSVPGQDVSLRYNYQGDSHTLELTESWQVGDVKNIPCIGAGKHLITVSMYQYVVLDTALHCDERPQEDSEDGSGEESTGSKGVYCERNIWVGSEEIASLPCVLG